MVVVSGGLVVGRGRSGALVLEVVVACSTFDGELWWDESWMLKLRLVCDSLVGGIILIAHPAGISVKRGEIRGKLLDFTFLGSRGDLFNQKDHSSHQPTKQQ